MMGLLFVIETEVSNMMGLILWSKPVSNIIELLFVIWTEVSNVMRLFWRFADRVSQYIYLSN